MIKNQYIAEAFGTFALVFAGCGAIVINDLFGSTLGHVGISLVFGLVVMAMIYAIGNISGAHINPAVTLGFLFAGRLDRREVFPYIAFQLLGALVAATLLRLLFPEHGTLGATLPAVDPIRAVVIEIVLSFLLMFVILNVSTGHMEKGIMAVTGASMNPARSIAPALLSGNLAELWIYIVGPVTGMLLAYPTCRWVQGSDCCTAASNELNTDSTERG